MTEQGQGGTAGAGVGQSGSASAPTKRGKLYVLGGLSCAMLLSCCCLTAVLGSWLEARERRAAYGPPAVARAFADRMLQLAAEDDASAQRATPADPIQMRQKDEASRDAYRDLAARVQVRAETLEEAELLNYLHSESERANQQVIDRLGAMLATLGPEDSAAREWLTERIGDCATTREQVASWVDDKRRDLERRYEENRRTRTGATTAGPDGRIDPGPQTGPAQGETQGAVEASVRLVRLNDLSESLRIKNCSTFAWRTRRIVLNGTYVTERAVAIAAGKSSDMTWSLNNFRDSQGRSFGPMNVRGISSITIETDVGVWEGTLD